MMNKTIRDEVKKRFGLSSYCFYDCSEKQYVLRLFNVVGNKSELSNKIYDLEDELFPNNDYFICAFAYDIEETKQYFPDKYDCSLFWEKISSFNLKKTVQAINFFLQNIYSKQLNELNLLKLIFFADRYYLQKNGVTVTGDTYYAMRNGPVASKTKNIFNRDEDRLSPEELQYINEYLKIKEAVVSPAKKYEASIFSSDELETLKNVSDLYHNLKQKNINVPQYTHLFFDWDRDYKPFLSPTANKRRSISPLEFFKNVQDDYCSIIPSDLREKNLERIQSLGK